MYQKQQSQVIIRTLIFQLKELARFYYNSNLLLSFENVLTTSSSSASTLTTYHLTQQVFANQSCLSQLIDFIKLFCHWSSFTFYTDSLMINLNSASIKAGYAWCEINTVVPFTF